MPGKYKVSHPEDRTLDGIIYDSKAEMQYAIRLTVELEAGEVAWWLRQVPIQLGPDFRTRIDFLVAEHVSPCPDDMCCFSVYGVEVKGVETAQFRTVRRLWSKYGPFPLRVVKRGATVDIIEHGG